MNSLLDDLPASARAHGCSEEDLAEALGTLFERTLIRDHVMPRIEGHDDINWLRANGVQVAVRSSVDQFVTQGIIKFAVTGREDVARWRTWRDN